MSIRTPYLPTPHQHPEKGSTAIEAASRPDSSCGRCSPNLSRVPRSLQPLPRPPTPPPRGSGLPRCPLDGRTVLGRPVTDAPLCLSALRFSGVWCPEEEADPELSAGQQMPHLQGDTSLVPETVGAFPSCGEFRGLFPHFEENGFRAGPGRVTQSTRHTSCPGGWTTHVPKARPSASIPPRSCWARPTGTLLWCWQKTAGEWLVARWERSLLKVSGVPLTAGPLQISPEDRRGWGRGPPGWHWPRI